MLVRPHYLACLSHASYVVVDEVSRVGAVVDPQRDVTRYLDEARALGISIRHVILTHFHADFVSGHLELAAATGASIHVGRRGRTAYPSVPVADGDVLDLGPTTRLVFRETPGHTPESVCVLVFDRTASDVAPHAILTGDTLFLGDVGRPDLMASAGASESELASALYDSLHERVLPLPDATIVYPAHGAGSLCGKRLSSATSSTLGEQRATNPALAPMTRDAFVRLVTTGQPEAPAYFRHDAELNRSDRPVLETGLAASARVLSLDDALAFAREGAVLVDVRPAAEFASGHLVDSVNVGLAGRFAQWAGTVIDPRDRIVVVAPPGAADEAALRLGRVGFDRVLGRLDDLAGALRDRPDLVRRLPRTSAVGELLRRLDGPDAPFVLDVRSLEERAAGHVDGSVCIPLPRLLARLDELPRDREIVVHCQTGYRSSLAASLLARASVSHVSDLVGGFAAFEAARTPVFPEA